MIAILVVDDDAPIRRMLERTLTAEGYAVESAADGGEALAAVERAVPDLVVLDVAMPGLDGLSVCRRLRRVGLGLPVLLLTARDAVSDRVAGLDAGADDYLIKPFDIDELSARLRAVARRVDRSAESVLTAGDVVLDLRQRRVTCRGEPAGLTAREYAVAELLMRKAGCLVTRAEIEEELYGFEDSIASNAIEVHIHNLRRKLGQHFITNLKGRGYRVEDVR